jgi:hypothetical protein
MKDFKFELLDTSDPAAVQEYEEAFYLSFSKVITNQLVRKLWLWDHERRRLKTRIPYEAQLICALRESSGKLHSAMAFNVALRELQAADYGFALSGKQAGAFEVLTYFAVEAKTLDVRSNFWARCVALLSACGFHTGYATTALRPLAMYRRVGWQVLEEREIESEQRFFLCYRISQLGRREETARQMLGLLIDARDLSGNATNEPRRFHI